MECSKLRKAISLEVVRHKDRMATESVAEICSPQCKLALLEIKEIHGDSIVYSLTSDNSTKCAG